METNKLYNIAEDTGVTVDFVNIFFEICVNYV